MSTKSNRQTITITPKQTKLRKSRKEAAYDEAKAKLEQDQQNQEAMKANAGVAPEANPEGTVVMTSDEGQGIEQGVMKLEESKEPSASEENREKADTEEIVPPASVAQDEATTGKEQVQEPEDQKVKDPETAAPATVGETKGKADDAPVANPQAPVVIPEKKMSGLDAAALVLKEAGTAMSCKEIMREMLTRKLWVTGGKTPDQTLHSAIIREIKVKGDKSRFFKARAGRFAAT